MVSQWKESVTQGYKPDYIQGYPCPTKKQNRLRNWLSSSVLIGNIFVQWLFNFSILCLTGIVGAAAYSLIKWLAA